MIGIGIGINRLRGLSDAYAIAGFSPKLVFAPTADTYRTGGSSTTFAGMIDYTGASNKTMTDSDGVLKWAPHNLLTWSEDFSNAAWVTTRVTTNPNATIAPDGTLTADEIVEDTTAANSHYVYSGGTTWGLNTYTQAVWAKIGNGTRKLSLTQSFGGAARSVIFDIVSGAVLTENGPISGAISDAGGGWFLCKVTYTTTSSTARFDYALNSDGSTGLESYNGDGNSSIYLWRAHLYRSDLGGMADNPDTGDSYVPTTSAALYLSRRNHHIWNGSAWVNAGMLVEPTAATNLVTYSRDFANVAGTWTKTLSTVVANAVGIDGVSNSAFTMTATAGAGEHKIDVRGIVPDPQTATMTASFHVKQGTARYVILSQQWSTNWVYAAFDLLLGTVTETASNGTGSLVAFNIVRAENGFWRISISGAIGTAGGDAMVLHISNVGTGLSNAYSFTAAGTETVIIDQADLIASSVPMSPIPTAGSTATRAAEARPYASSKLPYSATGMSFRIKGRATYADLNTAGQQTLYDRRVDANNRITVTLDTDGAKTGTFTLTVVNGGVSASVATTGQITPGVNKAFAIAWRVTSSQINIALNGTAATAVTSPGVPSLAAVGATMASTGTRELESAWDTDLGDSGISEASS